MLALAGVLKLRDPTAFAIEIANYQFFPGIAPYLAATLPTLEVVIGAALIALPLAWRRPGTWIALGLFGMFTVAVGAAYFRRIDIDCGCFGTGGGPIDALTLLRNLALCSGVGCLLSFDRPPIGGSTNG